MAVCKLSESQRARMVELRRQGWTLERLSGEIGVNRATIGRYLRRAEEAGERLPHARTGRPRKAAPRVGRPPTTSGDERLTALRAELAGMAGAADEVLAAIRTKRLPELGRLADEAIEDRNLILYRDAVRLEIEIAERIIMAAPAAPPDPEADPRYEPARERLLAKMRQLAEHATARRAELASRLCPVCRVVLEEHERGGA